MENDLPDYNQGMVENSAPIHSEPPKRYDVYLLDDDYTHLDFGLKVLKEVFFFADDDAYRLLMEVHNQGKCLCGTYTFDIAETKQEQVHSLASLEGHPLYCAIREHS